MKYAGYLHFRARVLIKEALRTAISGGIACATSLAGIADARFPFGRHDRRARRIWHDELQRQLGEIRLRAADAEGHPVLAGRSVAHDSGTSSSAVSSDCKGPN